METALMIEGQEDVTWEDWVAIARACEDCGVGTLFRSDHYYSVEDFADRGSLDALNTLAGLAAIVPIGRLAVGRWAGLVALVLCLTTGYLYGSIFFTPISTWRRSWPATARGCTPFSSR